VNIDLLNLLLDSLEDALGLTFSYLYYHIFGLDSLAPC